MPPSAYLRLPLVLAAVVLVTLACTRAQATPTPSPTSTVVATPTPLPEAATTPQLSPLRGGKLAIAARAPVPSYDVHQELSAALASSGPGLVYSRLLRLKAAPGALLPSLQVECELCQGWEVSDGGKTYLFHLRPEARWQNIAPVSGRLVTAQDVVYSLQRQRTAGWPNAGLLRSVGTVEAQGDATVKVTLVAPDADFLLALADGHTKVVAPEAVALKGDLTQGPSIGSGPWVLESSSDEFHALNRNSTYFETGVPFLDRLEVQVISDDATRMTAFRTGLLDVEELTASEWADFSPSHPQVRSLLYPATGVGMELAVNTKVAPFDQLQVRQALFRALDPWADINAAWLGQAYVSLGLPVAEAGWQLSRAELEPYFNSPDVARSLLQQASLPLPVAFPLTVGEFGDSYVQHAQRIAQALEAVGFQPTVRRVDLKTFSEQVWFGGEYTVFVGAVPPVSTPNGYLLSVLHSQGKWNTHGLADAQLDALIEAQSVSLDPVARSAQVREIELLLMNRAVRFMPATQVQRWAWWPQVQGFSPNFANLEYFHWARVWQQT